MCPVNATAINAMTARMSMSSMLGPAEGWAM
jgi:hypothetical protein